jgi:hypothetical protein
MRDEPGDVLIVTEDNPLHLPVQDIRVVLHQAKHSLVMNHFNKILLKSTCTCTLTVHYILHSQCISIPQNQEFPYDKKKNHVDYLNNKLTRYTTVHHQVQLNYLKLRNCSLFGLWRM